MSKLRVQPEQGRTLSGVMNWYNGKDMIGKHDHQQAEPLPDDRGLDLPRREAAVSTMSAAMSEWRKDWARYMPGHAWKMEDMFIVHGGGPRQERGPLPPQIRGYYSGLSAVVTKKHFLYNDLCDHPAQAARLADGPQKELCPGTVRCLDCTGRKTGARIGRDDAHANGVWHGAFHCLIFYRRREGIAPCSRDGPGRKRSLRTVRCERRRALYRGRGRCRGRPREIRENWGSRSRSHHWSRWGVGSSCTVSCRVFSNTSSRTFSCCRWIRDRTALSSSPTRSMPYLNWT